ncbi:putative adhesin [Lentzea sp. NPDC051208]|uniref:putative adhesin n=1 Tax=Lentzea sp. NPDC051208 TaxID=3154642 RepID=UPI0034196E6E
MAKAFVVAHGSYESEGRVDGTGVVVPNGKRVSCYADPDTRLPTAVLLAAVNAGDARPRHVYTAGDVLPNY